MLVRFKVKNFLSFRDEAEFSMVAADVESHPNHVIAHEGSTEKRILKTSVIYGANASGKSNFVKALDFARDFIIGNLATQRGEQIPRLPFMFDLDYMGEPARFEFEVKCGSRLLLYGFEVTSKIVISEWLFEWIGDNWELWFKRLDESKSYEVGKLLNAAVEELSLEPHQMPLIEGDTTPDSRRVSVSYLLGGTRPNQLFLNEAYNRGVKEFQALYDWFLRRLVLVFPDSHDTPIPFPQRIDEGFESKLAELMDIFGVGLTGVSLKPIDLEEDTRFSPSFKDDVRRAAQRTSNTTEGYRSLQLNETTLLFAVDEKEDMMSTEIFAEHIAKQGYTVQFQLGQESDGTRRLFVLAPIILDFLRENNDRVYVIDELERKLHPKLSFLILNMFLKNSGQKPSQLIVTTHETQILDLGLLRTDEIWFAEKDPDGGSSLFSLEEFTPRPSGDVRDEYLHGRFGATPIPLSVSNLGWADDDT
ncbi:MAG: AAA family ATPase [Chloroflexi bacterium]|nr:AAA family ATPase [Chloroflexota bacterium]